MTDANEHDTYPYPLPKNLTTESGWYLDEFRTMEERTREF